ncbi:MULTISPECIES: transcription antitermination factor NusB [Euryhalocaulis]|uniref:transcription antitermination factor NusB n=1 Tax=Euryhalocaulis TaxID=1712422 RepID=UPI0003A9487F|nr:MULTISPECIES: transcription antitermination factor NusB [Euryhalocaulis]MBA4802084.1 transcription antitermination factor NusB [Euryhalocaulis sp.]
MSENPSENRARLRAAARFSAVQALYQMEVSGRGAKAVVLEFRNYRFGGEHEVPDYIEADEDFFEDLVMGVVGRQDDIDSIVSKRLATGWRLDRIDSTLRAALRAGVYELTQRSDVPVKTIINEYVEIARDFFEDDSPKFINGVLDAVARDVRGGELALNG